MQSAVDIHKVIHMGRHAAAMRPLAASTAATYYYEPIKLSLVVSAETAEP